MRAMNVSCRPLAALLPLSFAVALVGCEGGGAIDIMRFQPGDYLASSVVYDAQYCEGELVAEWTADPPPTPEDLPEPDSAGEFYIGGDAAGLISSWASWDNVCHTTDGGYTYVCPEVVEITDWREQREDEPDRAWGTYITTTRSATFEWGTPTAVLLTTEKTEACEKTNPDSEWHCGKCPTQSKTVSRWYVYADWD